MRTRRRKFSLSAQFEIVARATDGRTARVHCEGCGMWLKHRSDYEIDHVIAEGVTPSFRQHRKLTAADGQLLCVALCHPKKTARDDAAIAEAKRRELEHQGAQGAPGRTEIQRRYGIGR